METARRGLALLQIVLAAGLVCGATRTLDGTQDEPQRCQIDALEKWYCATDPRGSAVIDPLGRVVCAPGACAKVDEKDWICSSVSGGTASAPPTGPVCEGQCRAPEATECKKL